MSPSIKTQQRQISKVYQHTNIGNTIWKKNSLEAISLFGQKVPIELDIMCNPLPSIDKTFDIIEYRADCFNINGTYLHNNSFTLLRIWNEYLDTTYQSLLLGTVSSYNDNLRIYREDGEIKTKSPFIPLRKKFRTWRILIPRAVYGNYSYTAIDYLGSGTVEVDRLKVTEAFIEGGYRKSRDRIRNPWCRIYLEMDTTDVDKIKIYDLIVSYFK